MDNTYKLSPGAGLGVWVWNSCMLQIFLWISCSKICMKLILQSFYETHTPKFLWNACSKVFLPQCLDDWLCIKFLMTQHNFLSLETLDWTLIGNMFEFHNIVSLFYVMYHVPHATLYVSESCQYNSSWKLATMH